MSRAVKRAVAELAAADETLGHDLARGLRTGLFCVYTLDPRFPIRWKV